MRYSFSRALPPIALGFAVVLVATLAVQNRSLKARYARLVERATLPHPGLVVPTFRGATLEGDSVTIGAPGAGRAQILFFFTTTCPYSRATLPAWNSIARAVRGQNKLRAYGIALDSLHLAIEYGRQQHFRFPVVVLPERKLADLYRVAGVPLTIVVSDAGRVLYARAGEITAEPAVDSVLAAVRVVPYAEPLGGEP